MMLSNGTVIRLCRLAALCLLIVGPLAGCGDDDDPAGPVDDAQYEVGFALWLFDPAEISVVAEVHRLDSSAAPADSCEVRMNDETLPLTSGDPDGSGYQLVLPGFSPGASYLMVATLDGRTAQCTLVAPQALSTLEILEPVDSAEIAPGESLLITWDYDGPTFAETDVGLVAACDASRFEHRALLAGAARAYTVPASVAGALDSCTGDAYVEVIARNSGAVEGALASPESKWYVVLASDINQLADTGGGSKSAGRGAEPKMAVLARGGLRYRQDGRVR